MKSLKIFKKVNLCFSSSLYSYIEIFNLDNFVNIKKALTKISSKYSNYIDVFLVNLKIKLPKHNSFNDYLNKLIKDKQPVYRLIYNFNLVKLKS